MRFVLQVVLLSFLWIGSTEGKTLAQDARPAEPTAPKSSGFDQTHTLWTEVLKAHVQADAFDYKKLKGERAKLDAYIRSIEAVTADDFESWTREQRFAFWIDAYNTYTVRRVVDAWPIASIKDLGDEKVSVWDQKRIPLERLFPDSQGEKLSLNDIENEILRPKFKDARVHMAINCASKGCPPLLDTAFTAEQLNDQLNAQARRFMADASRNRFDRAANRVMVSSLFDWFKDDFARDAGSVQAWVAKYAGSEDGTWIGAAKGLKVEFLEYSWKLNDVSRE